MYTKSRDRRVFIYSIAGFAIFALLLSNPVMSMTSDNKNIAANETNRSGKTIELVSPKDARVVSTIGIELSWNVTDGNAAVFTYDVYVSEDGEKVTENDRAARLGSGLTETSLKAMILLDKTTYYWKVVGNNIDDNDEISSLVGLFSIDQSIQDPDNYLGISISNPTPRYGEEVYFAAIVPNSFGRFITYSWEFPDSEVIIEGSDKAKVAHSFQGSGQRTVHLTVSDELGNEQSTSVHVNAMRGDPAACSGGYGEDKSDTLLFVACPVVVFIIIIIVVAAISAQAKEKERQKNQFALPSEMYEVEDKGDYADEEVDRIYNMEWYMEKGFRKVSDEIRKMTKTTKEMIKGERFGRYISIFIVTFAISTMVSAYLQSNSNQESTEKYSLAKTYLEDSNTLLLQAESIIDNDINLLEQARRYYVEGENLLWKYIQKTLNGTPGSYSNEKGDSLIAFNNAYGLIVQSNMHRSNHIRRSYSVNLADFDDFVPWDYGNEQIKLVSIDILSILEDYESDFDSYEEKLKEESASLRRIADREFDMAKEKGDEGLAYTRTTTFFSIATSIIGISIVPKNKYTRRILIFVGMAIFGAGFIFIQLY